jgi:hypothetical protein
MFSTSFSHSMYLYHITCTFVVVRSIQEPNRLNFFRRAISFSVTLAWDDKDNLSDAFSKLNLHDFTYVPPFLGLGRVGPYGTVLKGGGWGQFPIPAAIRMYSDSK